MAFPLRTALAITSIAFANSAIAQGAPRTVQLVAEGGKDAGTITMTQAPRGVLIRVEANALTPGWHGMHIHSIGTCADPGFKASGGHVHGAGTGASVHGLLNRDETDLGDLPNIFASADGHAAAEVFAPNVSLGPATDRMDLLDADGSAIVIHAASDDHISQPIGGAGARIACGAIR